ncbi:winged helix DNA-binding domain-containing protein [Choiromyces venosus 120613-1]|uniref:ESCRT-II complex subunit VPS25 n=1 Tax=Choiromyces venosus 120613-1 TaxID=1336337 RepID=A0A3N4JP60_9PEZI|nr:winged helix DNA-binding domain-containing protein [Choiromyces venosus 120613-1]
MSSGGGGEGALTGYVGRFKQRDAVELLEYMAEEGDVEWEGVGKAAAIVYWKKPEEWANVIYEWIDNTGQKGSVLTLYEISEGDLTRNQEFHTIDPYVLRKALDVLVRRSLAQVFGANEEMGVKFF